MRPLREGGRPVGYLYRAVDQFGQVIDVYASIRRDLAAARTFFHRARRNRIEADLFSAPTAASADARHQDHDRAAGVAAGHAFVQNPHRGRYEIAADEPAGRRLALAFTELVKAI